MKYVKAQAEIVKFDKQEIFMTGSNNPGSCEGYSATPTVQYDNALHAISCNVYIRAGYTKPMEASPCPCINSETGHCYVYG